MTLQLLQQVMAYRPPKDLHPIAELVCALYVKCEGRFDREALDTLRDELEFLSSDLKTLTDANCALCAFIKVARDEWRNPKAARAVEQLVEETIPKYRNLFQMLAGTLTTVLQDFAHHSTMLFDRLVGRKEPPRAPKIDDRPPPGTVPLKRLSSSSRPPPIVRPRRQRQHG